MSKPATDTIPATIMPGLDEETLARFVGFKDKFGMSMLAYSTKHKIEYVRLKEWWDAGGDMDNMPKYTPNSKMHGVTVQKFGVRNKDLVEEFGVTKSKVTQQARRASSLEDLRKRLARVAKAQRLIEQARALEALNR
jgi:hypothetical protein